MMFDTYLSVMIESLEKKDALLSALEQKSMEQTEMIKNPDSLLADIDHNMDEKAELIDELTKIDTGFEALYSDIKEGLNEHKDEYKEQIKTIQNLIGDVMAKSASVQAIEARNKTEMEKRFAAEKKELQQRKNVSKVAYDYYATSNKIDLYTPQFMDKKK